VICFILCRGRTPCGPRLCQRDEGPHGVCGPYEIQNLRLMPSFIIAIDGPAAAGKGTLARRLAQHFGLAFLDTGRLYRAVGFKLLLNNLDPRDPAAAEQAARALRPDDLDQPGLRDEAVSEAASLVAAQPAVRAALLDFQRAFAHDPPGGAKGAVLDGRDIGTVICPDAQAKLYVHARVEIRAQRRLKELQESGHEAIYSRVLQDMKDRDDRDRSRGIAALKPAEDAFDLDTSDLDADRVFERALSFINSRSPAGA
jgi:CMP/dCMP kinase